MASLETVICTLRDNRLMKVRNEMRKKGPTHFTSAVKLHNIGNVRYLNVHSSWENHGVEESSGEKGSSVFCCLRSYGGCLLVFKKGERNTFFHTFFQISAFTALSCWHCVMEWEINGVVEVTVSSDVFSKEKI